MAYVITAVGAGGKTTYLKERAREFLCQGKRVAMTTTTHIWPPFPERACAGRAEGKVLSRTASSGAWKENRWESPPDGPDYYGIPESSGKLSAPSPEVFEQICRDYDIVLVEGDGSHCMPAKIPGACEPVIPPHTDEIVVVMGAHAGGRRLDVVCQRYNGDSREPVTEHMLQALAEQYYLRPLQRRYPEAVVSYVLSRMRHSDDRIRCILMASGFGRRYGGNKLLDLYRGKPLYRHVLDHITQAVGKENITVVTQYEEIARKVREMGTDAVMNLRAAEGISASIRIGTQRAVDAGADAVMFFAADMPNLDADEIRRYVRQFLDSGKPFGCMEFGKEHICTNPGAFRLKTGAGRLLQLRGDSGAMKIMKREPWNIYYYQIAPEYTVDIDRK